MKFKTKNIIKAPASMARFVKGDVVVVPFPFSDLTQTKRRPALVLAQLEGNDRILCQITSKHIRDPYAIELKPHQTFYCLFQKSPEISQLCLTMF